MRSASRRKTSGDLWRTAVVAEEEPLRSTLCSSIGMVLDEPASLLWVVLKEALDGVGRAVLLLMLCSLGARLRRLETRRTAGARRRRVGECIDLPGEEK